MYHEPEPDKLKEECGVFGVYSRHLLLTEMTYYGIFALQHRGQESAGIAVSDGLTMAYHKGQGLVSEVFTKDILQDLTRAGDCCAVGHTRYSTTKINGPLNAQPLIARYLEGGFAIAHNGNLVNAIAIRRQLESEGYVFQSHSDTECMLNLLAKYRYLGVDEALRKMVDIVQGAYSLVMIYDGKLIGMRDPAGIRPLCLGMKDDSYVLASESSALITVGARPIRDIEPGEAVIIDDSGLRSLHFPKKSDRGGLCVFEYVYFARPDSTINGKSVYLTRHKMGERLAIESPVEADVVTPVPDSGRSAAVGYSLASGIPFTEGLIKNRYVARTFITPSQDVRQLQVRLKLSPIPEVFAGKRVILIDDSIVRGNTIRSLINLIREAGAAEVHVRISSPPYISPCYYGIDTPDIDVLAAARYSIEEIRKKIGADSLCYLSMEGLMEAIGGKMEDYCTSCFTGDYFAGRVEDE